MLSETLTFKSPLGAASRSITTFSETVIASLLLAARVLRAALMLSETEMLSETLTLGYGA
jgi:hypothetical protein